jgi:hypothetical protein
MGISKIHVLSSCLPVRVRTQTGASRNPSLPPYPPHRGGIKEGSALIEGGLKRGAPSSRGD